MEPVIDRQLTQTVTIEARVPSAVPAGTSRRRWLWAAALSCIALIPFHEGLTGSRVFYIRDLGMFFWGRYLFLRRAWLSGEWPLWDPFIGGGQAAYADPLNQMFLPPAIAARLIGGEALGFGLWVALPFPLAAVGTFGFFARHFSAPASALGAVAFALCGPVISGGNFPNMSWSVAGIPWIIWAADAVISRPTPQRMAALAVATALQCLAGEPVTVFTTVVLAAAYTLTFGDPAAAHDTARSRLRAAGLVLAALALGAALAGVQLIPMLHAAASADRAATIGQDLWSLRPTALLETVWLHLFGNYYEATFLSDVPWMPLMYTDREPFFFSIYFGVPLLALAAFGFAGTAPRRWRLFWAVAGFVALVGSFGSYTPIYPILRDYVPPFGSFRFPVKYLVVTAFTVAAGAAAGWDSLAGQFGDRRDWTDVRRRLRARLAGIGVALVPGALAAAFAAVCVYAPDSIRDPLRAIARAFGDGATSSLDLTPKTDAAEFMIRTVPQSAAALIVPACAAAFLLWFGSGRQRWGPHARYGLALLIVVDLLIKGSGINPAFDPAYLEPTWLAHTRADPDARFYFGAKHGGTIAGLDVDAHGGYLEVPGLSGSAWRAAVINQAAFYPSAWRGREMLSYDLPVLWPRVHDEILERFVESSEEDRARFLDRTGVKYRILPERRAQGRRRLTPIPHFNGSFLFDWGEVAARTSIVPEVHVVPDLDEQIEAMFEDGWDIRQTALVEREPPVAGRPGTPIQPFARIVEDRPNRTVVEAGTGPGGGYLVMLDSFADDWRVRVDGSESSMVRGNALFRVVRLAEGRHIVEFDYRPRALVWGASVSTIAFAVMAGLIAWDGRRARSSGDQKRTAFRAPAPAGSD